MTTSMTISMIMVIPTGMRMDTITGMRMDTITGMGTGTVIMRTLAASDACWPR